MQEATTPKTEEFTEPQSDDNLAAIATPPQPIKTSDGSPPQLPYTKIRVVDKSRLEFGTVFRRMTSEKDTQRNGRTS